MARNGLGRVLVLQHIRCEPPAVYEEILDERGASIDRVELDEGDELPSTLDYAALIVMGGPMGALDDDDHPWLAAERDYIAAAVAAGVPFWGVCLGAQLLAAVLGARVYRGPTPEVGTYPIALTAEAMEDPVFRELPRDLSVFQWHSDSFDLPDGARLLARSDMYDHQAFAVGSAYGIQFHVEAGPDLAAEWAGVDSYRRALQGLYGPDGVEKVLGELRSNAASNREVATTIFNAWVDRFLADTTAPLHGSRRSSA